MEQTIKKIVTTALNEKLFSAVEILLAFDKKILFHQAYGHTNSLKTTKLAKNSIFDLASITKALATSLAILKLCEQKKIKLTDKIAKFYPQYKQKPKNIITIQHLLTHTSGLPAWEDLSNLEWNQKTAFTKLLNIPLERKVGIKVVYSCLGFILLGNIINLVSGQNLKTFCNKNFYEPLQLKNTNFSPIFPSKMVVATSYDEASKKYLVGVVEDKNCRIFNGSSGNAGLFSTAKEIYLLSQTLLDNQSNQGLKLLTAKSINLIWSRQTSKNTAWSLGWRYFDGNPDYCHLPNTIKKGAVGHLGFTGTSLFIEPTNKTIYTILTNRAHTNAPITKIKKFRMQITELLFQYKNKIKT